MFMGYDHNTRSYLCQYANVFDSDNTNPYIRQMPEMRKILSFLMGKAGDDAYSLQTKSGVPQPTTQRFLTGKHGEPRSSTVRKWAKVYGVTESQMRGDVPIEGMPGSDVRKQASTPQGEALTKEQKQILSLMGSMDKDARDALLKMGNLLAKRPPGRRKKNIGHNPERRLASKTYGDSSYINSVFESAEQPEHTSKREKK